MKQALPPESIVISPYWTFIEFGGVLKAISDHDAFDIKPGAAADIAGLVSDTPKKVNVLVDELRSRHPAPQIYFGLLQFLKKTILLDASQMPETPSGPLPEIETGHLILPGAPINLFLEGPASRLLQPFKKLAERSGFAISAEAEEADCQVFLADHYFDPSLLESARRAREAERLFAPAKLQGLVPWFGPLFFERGRPPCFKCFFARFHGNHLACEAALLGSRPFQNPIVPELEQRASLLFLKEIASAREHRSSGQAASELVRWDRETSSWQRHRTLHRPQCPICGTPRKPFPANLDSIPPLLFKSRPKVCFPDGIWRAKQDPQLSQAMESHLDSKTGTISHLWEPRTIPAFLGRHLTTAYSYGDFPSRTQPRRRLIERGNAAGGKGKTDEQARNGAFGEAIERFALWGYGLEVSGLAARPSRLPGGRFVTLETLAGFSEKQYRERNSWDGRHATNHVPEIPERDAEIAWIPAWSLVSGQWVYVPKAHVSAEASRRENLWIAADSNGFAAGPTLEEALIQGACELIERDGIGLWWHHRLQKPGVRIETIPSEFIQNARAGMEKEGFDFHLLDLGTDLRVPVFGVLAIGRETLEILPGFGAALDPLLAAERAVLELGQFWEARNLFSFDRVADDYGHPELKHHPFFRPDPAIPLRDWSEFNNYSSSTDLLEDLDFLTRQFEEAGFDFLAVDASLADLPAPVARAIVPGIVHFWPRFGIERLFTAPVKLGWMKQRPTEESLNPVPLVF